MRAAPKNRIILAPVSVLLGLAVLLTLQQGSAAQKVRTAALKSSHKKQQEAQRVQQGAWNFGDIVLRDYVVAKGTVDEVHVTGLKVTVVSVDPKAGSNNHMTAREFVATMGAGGAVDKVEAIGAMTFSGKRPAVGRKGIQTFEGSGSRGTYFKKDGRLELEGPVTYYIEQPTVTGDDKQWVRGTAGRAIYDENKKVLHLYDEVRAKVMDPTALKKDVPSSIVADEATLDFSEAKVTFEFKNRSPEGGEVKINPKVEPKKEQKKDKP